MNYLLTVVILQLFTNGLIVKAQRVVVDTDESCNQVITDGTEGKVSSPGYPTFNYKSSSACNYTIVVPPNNIIAYVGTHMDLEDPDPLSGLCVYDSVDIYDGNLLSKTFCANQQIYLNGTTTNRLTITFTSDFTTENSGFEIEWKVLDPAERLITPNCNFDQAIPLCAGWSNINPIYSWYFTRGHTPSANTGPVSDHTTGLAEGRYAYIEGSKVQRDTTASLKSPKIAADENDHEHCLIFWYHMYGKGIGSLRVFFVDDNNQTILLTDLQGPKGDEWLKEEVTIRLHPLTKSFELIFEGTRGYNYMSDIAIDDISITDGMCKDVSRIIDLNTFLSEETSTATTVVPTVAFICPPNLQKCEKNCNLTCKHLKEDISCLRYCRDGCGCPLQSPILHENRCNTSNICYSSDNTTTTSASTTSSTTVFSSLTTNLSSLFTTSYNSFETTTTSSSTTTSKSPKLSSSSTTTTSSSSSTTSTNSPKTTTTSSSTTTTATTKESTKSSSIKTNVNIRNEREKEKIHGNLMKLILDAVHSAVKKIPN